MISKPDDVPQQQGQRGCVSLVRKDFPDTHTIVLVFARAIGVFKKQERKQAAWHVVIAFAHGLWPDHLLEADWWEVCHQREFLCVCVCSILVVGARPKLAKIPFRPWVF